MSSSSGVATSVSELLYPCYLLTYLLTERRWKEWGEERKGKATGVSDRRPDADDFVRVRSTVKCAPKSTMRFLIRLSLYVQVLRIRPLAVKNN